MAPVPLDEIEVQHDHTGSGPDLLSSIPAHRSHRVRRVLPSLAASRRVTRFNLPGFGGSTSIVLESVADHADHVAHVMTALDLGPVTAVFGNGFGAFVAAELAIRHGARLGPPVLADAVAAFPEPARAPFRAMAEKVRADGMPAVLDAAIGRMFPPEFAPRTRRWSAARKPALAGVAPGCFARACLALASLDLTPRLGDIAQSRRWCVRRARSDHAARARARACRPDPRRGLSRDPGLGTLPDARAARGAGRARVGLPRLARLTRPLSPA